jgi:hypothetical protein
MEQPENNPYAPEEAARAMLAGKVLKDKSGWKHFWGRDSRGWIGFFRWKEIGPLCPVYDFSNLYEEKGE